MNNKFPQQAMSKFSKQFSGMNLTSLHATNPQPFSQSELERVIGMSFAEILQDVPLGFCADEGSQALRESVSNNLFDSSQFDQVITHAGAQEALFCAFHALLSAGDRVLAVAPLFMPLVEVPIDIGCRVSFIYMDASNEWHLDFNQLEDEFKLGCKLFIINFPNNPTGATLTHNEIHALVELCRKYNVWLLSDEVFRGLEHDSSLKLPCVADIYEKGVSVGVISKAFAIPGIRVGWQVCQNQDFRDRVIDVKSYLSICNSQVDEALATEILNQSQTILSRNVDLVVKNKVVLEKVQTLLGTKVNIILPKAGCCVFGLLNTDSDQLVNKMAMTKTYLFYPSSLFKAQQHGVRIGFGYKNFETMISDCL